MGPSGTKPTGIVGGAVYTPSGIIPDGGVVVVDGLITAVGHRADVALPADATVIDAAGRRVIPGLIDLHLHGMVGQDVAAGDLSVVSVALAERGITTFLPTLAAAPLAEMVGSIERLAQQIESGLSGARAVGIYLEGPFISPARAGVLDPRFFRLPSLSEMEELLRAGRGQVRVVSVAPELDGGLELVSYLSSRGVVVAVGHSDATFEPVVAAVERGLSLATHTFNAARPFHQRQPGVIGAILDRDEITAELIADGHHVHPAAIRLLLRVKGADSVCLVSDAAPLAGLPPGTYAWLGRRVMVDESLARLEDGTLAGSVMPLNQALRNLVEATALPFEVALRTATSTPASVLGLNSGRIEVGRDADIVVLDADFQTVAVMIRGTIFPGNWAGNRNLS